MLSAPALLAEMHDFGAFDSGNANLDNWLRQRAWKNQIAGASRTYVVADQREVIGFYCLASGSLAAAEAPASLRRNMPNPLPMVILGRLAIDGRWQGKGIGAALLQDAVARVGQAADIIGVRGIVVHAISLEAKAFYERYGFSATPANPMTLVLSVRQSPV